ncbi:unnamed protein product [Calicophoron daubneyi]|uniref:Nucleolar protein 12 n=1 Tax=Calicophoron daubneyi TaxID=300641 RepID=A0AAV2TR02_CALDB
MKLRRTPKLSLVFDEEKRREYLTGFHKRKLKRKEEGRKAAERRLAEEIKAVKTKYREAARRRMEGLDFPEFPDYSSDTVKSHKEHQIGDHTVVVEEIDISNSHYFIGASQPAPQISEPLETDERPLMSLKAALKMNPEKKRRHHKIKSNQKSARHRGRRKKR